MAQAAENIRENFEAAASAGPIDDVALIEERIETGLEALLDSYEPKLRLDDKPYDMVGDLYRIDVSHPLPQFDTGAAKAYSAQDMHHPERALYALVSDPKIPYRSQAIDVMRSLRPNHSTLLVDSASVRLSHLNEQRRVLVLTRPTGTTLANHIKEGLRFNDHQVIDTVLRPIVEVLLAMHEKQLSHGRINSANIYLEDNKIILGECLSEPSGLTQPYFYEPFERLLADPMGKGEANEKTDAYAIAILAYELLYGIDSLRTVNKEEFQRALVEKGTYHLLSANREFGEQFTDFFRGTLLESKQERWGLEQIRNWLGGKRYNLIHPSLPNEASRPFTLNEREYYSRRSVAYGISRHWAQWAKDVRTAKLDRWLETSIHSSDVADRVARVIRNCGGEISRNERHNNEMNARLIITLDPTGPIRMKDVAFNVDGMGTEMAHFFMQGRQAELNMMMDSIDFDLPSFWFDNSNIVKSAQSTSMLWKLQQQRSQIRQNHMGMGMERAIYDLNPGLVCQSALLLPYHILTIEDALQTLDVLAKTHAKHHSLLDRHIAAFLASKIEMPKEIQFENLMRLPKLKNNPELQVLRIIGLAQEKCGRPRLQGLATWVAMRTELLIDHIQNRQLRKKLKQSLKRAASAGIVNHVIATLTDSPVTKEDHSGFAKASIMYNRNLQRIESLKNPKALQYMSRELGGRMACFVAYTILSITCFILLNKHYL